VWQSSSATDTTGATNANTITNSSGISKVRSEGNLRQRAANQHPTPHSSYYHYSGSSAVSDRTSTTIISGASAGTDHGTVGAGSTTTGLGGVGVSIVPSGAELLEGEEEWERFA